MPQGISVHLVDRYTSSTHIKEKKITSSSSNMSVIYGYFAYCLVCL